MVFTGRAIYSSGVFNTTADDVAEEISIISPYETPLLDLLGQAPYAATQTFHEWLEEELGPNTIVSSTDHANTSSTGIGVHAVGGSGAVTGYLQAGMILKETVTGEYMQIASISGNTITVTRAVAGTVAATISSASVLYVISTAELEGAAITTDVTVPRTRPGNYVQLFKKDVILSGTLQAITQLGVANEFERQRTNRTKEVLRDLEKAVIQGRSLGNTIGTSAAQRSFNGIMALITTNIVTTLSTITTITDVDNAIELAWGNGGEPDWIICDPIKKRQLSMLQSPRIVVNQGQQDETFHNKIDTIETDSGTLKILKSRWMPSNSAILIQSDHIHVVPLQGRSFQFQEKPFAGDARTGFLVGEYTVELRNEKGMTKIV